MRHARPMTAGVLLGMALLTLGACTATTRRTAPPPAAPQQQIAALPPPAPPAPSEEAIQLAHMLNARTLDDKCRAMPKRMRAEYDAAVERIASRYEARSGAAALDAVRADAAGRGAQPFECDTGTVLSIRDAVRDARRIARIP